MPTFKAYLVEPAAGTIRPVAIRQDNYFAEIRSLIGCELIDMVRIDDAHHLVLDDNGLTDGLHCFTQVRGYASPLAGNLLVVGTNEDGNTVDVRASIEEIATSLTIVRPVLDPVFETLDGPTVFGTRLSGMQLRIENMTPSIIAVQ